MGRQITVTREIIEKARRDLFTENYLDDLADIVLKLIEEETGVEWAYLPVMEVDRQPNVISFYDVLDRDLWCNPGSKRVSIYSPELSQMLSASNIIRYRKTDVDLEPFSFEFPGYPRRLGK